MLRFILTFLFLNIIISNNLYPKDHEFKMWLNDFKLRAVNSGISETVVNDVMSSAVFLPKVIEYDRFQPEFYEDTFTYIKKRTSKSKVRDGVKLYKKEKEIIEKVEKEFKVEKELLLALMGIKQILDIIGKMDIVSSLATLSFDKKMNFFKVNYITQVSR